MSTTDKPTWLRNHQGLLEVMNFNLHVPTNMGNFTSLENASNFNRGLKQFLYWKGQLLPSLTKSTIFLAFLGPQGLTFPNVMNVAKALRPICDFTKLIETYTGANSNFLAFSFSQSSVVQDIINNFTFFENTIVLTVAHSDTEFHRFRLLWLPPLFDVARVHHLLGGFTQSHHLKRESINMGEGQFSNTNVVSGILTLKPGETLNNLPHLIRLPTPHKGCALLHLESRPPLCLRCRVVGHTRRKCTMTRCAACDRVHFPSAACGTSSYSLVAAKGITIYQEEDWISRLVDDLDQATTQYSPENEVTNSATTTHSGLQNAASDLTISPHEKSIDFVSSINTISEKCDRTLTVFSGDDSHSVAAVVSKTDFSASLSTTTTITKPKKCNKKSRAVSQDSGEASGAHSSPLQTSSKITAPVIATYSRTHPPVKVLATSLSSPSDTNITNLRLPSSDEKDYQLTSKITSDFLLKDALSEGPHFSQSFSPDSEHVLHDNMDLDSSSSTFQEPISRKRKVSDSSRNGDGSISSLDSSSGPLSGDEGWDSCVPSSATSSDVDDDIDLDSSLFGSTAPAPMKIEEKLGLYLKLDSQQIEQLKSMCHKKTITYNVLNIVDILLSHKVNFKTILQYPQLFKLRFHVVQYRISHLLKYKNSFTLKELFHEIHRWRSC